MNRCPLCGAATRRVYCYAHSWAGYDTPAKREPTTIVKTVVEKPRLTYADGWNARREYEAAQHNLNGRPSAAARTIST